MSDTNDITGDAQQTRPPSDEYREGWERIFGSKKEKPQTNDKDEV